MNRNNVMRRLRAGEIQSEGHRFLCPGGNLAQENQEREKERDSLHGRNESSGLSKPHVKDYAKKQAYMAARASSCRGSPPAQGGGGVKMADGNGQGIGGVSGFGDGIEAEQMRDHVLDLPLPGSAIAYDSGFDRKRGVFGDLYSATGCRQHGYATNLTQLQRRLRIDGIEDIFDSDVVGLVFLDEGAETVKDDGQALRQRFTGGKLDGAAGEANQTIVRAQFHDPETCVLGPAINPHSAHREEFILRSVVSGQLSGAENWPLTTDNCFLSNSEACEPWPIHIPGEK
jgi:hypothetical protein